MSKTNQYWILKEELKFGDEVSSNPKDHACATVLFRIPICTDKPENALHLIEYSAYQKLQAALDVAREGLACRYAPHKHSSAYMCKECYTLSKIEELLK